MWEGRKRRRAVVSFALTLVLMLGIYPCNISFAMGIGADAADVSVKTAGYNLDNFHTVYTTVDGEEINSKSDGVVTVLVFARTNGKCWNSMNVVKTISQCEWIKDEQVRVLVVDIDQEPVETVRAMQKSTGEGPIKFCYDETFVAVNSMWKYVDSVMDSQASITFPITVLIDKQDKMQDCLTGLVSSDELLKRVTELLGRTPGDTSGVETAQEADIYVEGTFDEEEAFDVLKSVNAARAEQGLNALVMDEGLMEKAMQRAAECAVYYSHTRPNGTRCFTILDNAYLSGCAENIAAGYTSAQAVMDGWLSSSGHYANIMGDNYTAIGVGCFYQNGVKYWVQLFSVHTEKACEKQEDTYKKTAVVHADKEYLGELTLSYTECSKKGDVAYPKLTLANLGFGSSEPSVSSFQFQSSNEAVVLVDTEGKVTAKGPGTATVTASLNGVKEAVYSFTIAADGAEGEEGEFEGEITQDYAALVNPFFNEDEFAFRIDCKSGELLSEIAKITVPDSSKWAGKKLYYYEIKEDGTYSYVCRSTVAADGTYKIRQKDGSSYVAITRVPENLGDCDGEAGITSKDALAILKYSVGIPQEYFIAEFADCDGEDGITSKDALAILKYNIGIISAFE